VRAYRRNMASGAPDEDRRARRRTASRTGWARQVAFKAVAFFFGLIWLSFCFGLIDLSALLGGPVDDAVAVEEDVGVLSVAYGGVATFMVAGAFFAQAWAPRGWPAATQQIVALSLAFAAAGVLGLDPLSFISVATLITMLAILLALHPLRRPDLRPSTRSISLPVLLVTALGALPWLVYARSMSANSRARLIPDDSASRPQAGGWAGAAVLAFAVLLLALLASTRTPGWRLPLWTTAATVLAFAWVTAANPALPGSPGRSWGMLAAAWIVALLLVAETHAWHGRRRPPQRRKRPASQ
jgi:hypothetical protein